MSQTTFSNLSQWEVRLGPTVNDPPAEYIRPYYDSALDTLTVIMEGSVANAGGMVCASLPWPEFPASGVMYVGLNLETRMTAATLAILRCWECDFKGVVNAAPNAQTVIPNVFDGSAQIVIPEAWQWQIDNPSWVPAGLTAQPIQPDTWTPMTFRYKCDITASKFSVLSLCGQAVPAGLQNLSLLPSNWTRCAQIQLQACLQVPGAVMIEYRGVELIFSDEVIP